MQARYKVPLDLGSKILTVGPEYRNHRGGVGAVIEAYSRNFELFNFISTHKEGSALLKTGVFLAGLCKLFFTLLTNRQLKIIHIHGASSASFFRKFSVFVIGKYIFKKKIIYHIHGGGFRQFYIESNWFSKKIIRFFLNKAETVICVSLAWQEYFQQNFKTKGIVFLPNIINYPQKEANRKDYSPLTFLFMGLVTESKGIFDLLDVIVENKDKYRDKIKLLIGGNGKIEKLTDLIHKHKVDELVEYLGWVKGDDKIKILNQANIYILPSYIEGSPISILEAMSYGMPVISTKVGGIPELVKNNENGLLIEPGDLVQMAIAIDYFITKPELIENYGGVSWQLAQEHLPDSVMTKLIDVYQSALSPDKQFK